MKKFPKAFFLALGIFLVSFLDPEKVAAVRYELITPSGPFTRGQVVQIGVIIDTQGESLESAQIDLSYKNDFLEYQGVEAGTVFPTVEGAITGTNTIRVVGRIESGDTKKSGVGLLAQINFRIIYDAAGETEFCTIVGRPTPTQPPASPQPTIELPPTGRAESLVIFTALGILFGLSSFVLIRFAKG
jgi:hypothetical protein